MVSCISVHSKWAFRNWAEPRYQRSSVYEMQFVGREKMVFCWLGHLHKPIELIAKRNASQANEMNRSPQRHIFGSIGTHNEQQIIRRPWNQSGQTLLNRDLGESRSTHKMAWYLYARREEKRKRDEHTRNHQIQRSEVSKLNGFRDGNGGERERRESQQMESFNYYRDICPNHWPTPLHPLANHPPPTRERPQPECFVCSNIGETKQNKTKKGLTRINLNINSKLSL